ncbi:MAG: endolytic transglycosylase MltG [Clostridiales bacterium]|nr:endolytic transglycosylase MltG [Clostridiales bacterium]
MSQTKNKKQVGKKRKRLSLIIAVLAILLVITGVYAFGLSPVDPGNDEAIVVDIPSGTGASQVVYILDDAGLVRNVFFAKINARIGRYNSLQANAYIFSKGMSFPKMMNAINKGSFEYISKRSVEVADGARLEQVAAAMSKELDFSAQEIMDKWSDKKYIKKLIDKYWFLTDEILSDDVIYPLEGYLYADTYFVTTENSTIEEFTEMCLDRMDAELTPRKDQIKASGFTVHKFLTLTSIVTKEARAGDQPEVAGVFINRLNKNMSLGSDVTVCYIFQEDRVELKVSQLESDNPYNTRKFEGLPPGPICQVVGEGMDAVLKYKKTDNIYFFADADGKVHFFKTQAEFEKGIEEIGLLQDD